MHEHASIREEAAALMEIDCVIIGVNCGKTLGRCIESVLHSRYRQQVHLHYVDGGSSDESIAVAGRYPEVRVVALTPEYPTPGSGRNAGWRSGSAPVVQFLDSDTVMDPDWLQRGAETLQADADLGAVFGCRNELHPERSVYNWIGDLEWNPKAGNADCFGGDVMIRRVALEATGGYDAVLVGGEDPELSRRIIRAGWNIAHLDVPMTRHDLAMTSVRQYLRRAFRSGYGFAAVRRREASVGSRFWGYDLAKIVAKGGGSLACIMLAALLPLLGTSPGILFCSGLLTAAGTGLLLSPRILRTGKFMQAFNLDRRQAARYAWHCSLVVIPQFFGVVRFHAGRLFCQPLRNRRNALVTNLSNTAHHEH